MQTISSSDRRRAILGRPGTPSQEGRLGLVSIGRERGRERDWDITTGAG